VNLPPGKPGSGSDRLADSSGLASRRLAG
jgi:hypothetical protein